jgi:hypothetical protein
MYIDPTFEMARREIEVRFNAVLPKPFKAVVSLKVVTIEGNQLPKFTPFPYCQN